MHTILIIPALYSSTLVIKCFKSSVLSIVILLASLVL